MNKKLFEMLKNHDWTYKYADDYRYYRSGSDEFMAILKEIKTISDLALALSFTHRVPPPEKPFYISCVQNHFEANKALLEQQKQNIIQ